MASGESQRASGASIVADLRAVTGESSRPRKQLSTLEARGALAAQRGRADYVVPETKGGGGIASPLVETAYADRTYYDEVTITSTDGLLTLKIKPIKSVKSRDANSAEVQQIYAAPPKSGSTS